MTDNHSSLQALTSKQNLVTYKFDVLADPVHAWVKVHKRHLTYFFGEHWRKHFTCFSYERGDYVYLDEDEDTTTLIKGMQDQGFRAVFREPRRSKTTSRVRSYKPLAPI